LVDDIKSIAAAFTELFSFGTNKKFDELIEKWGVFGKIIEGIANALKITKEFFTGDTEAFDDRQNKAKLKQEKLSSMTNKEYFQYLKDSFSKKPATNQGSTVNVTNNNSVTINGTADKNDVSDGMNDALTKANKQLDLQLSRGGAK
jgi:hypothetical protein